MYKRILVATDGSGQAGTAIAQAATLAAQLKAQLFILTVSEPLPVFSKSELGWSLPPDVYERMQQVDDIKARRILDEAVSIATDHGSPAAETIHLADRAPYAGILEAAKAHDIDLIVMAPHSKGLVDRLLLGSQASKVLSLADRPVLLVRGPAA